MHKRKLSIIGGGIPGLCLALILAKQGISVAVFERFTLPQTDHIKPSARTVALMQGALRTLARAGVSDTYKDQCAPIYGLSVVDDSLFPRGADNMVRQDFKPHEIGEDIFGYNVPMNLMIAALAAEVRQNKNITMFENAEIKDIQCDDVCVSVTLKDGQSIISDLVVGADGRKSLVREKAGIQAKTDEYDQKAITCLIDHTLPHNGVSTEFHRNGGPFTLVPMKGNQSAIVWVEKTEDADAFMALPKESFEDAIQKRSRDLVGKVSLALEPQSWPLIALKAEKLYGKRTVLIAEAAHVMSPIGAQGLNLSLRDVDDLADTLIEALKTGQDIGSETILSAYAKLRRKDMTLRTVGIDIYNRGVANDNPLIRGLRRFGLRAFNHAGPLRSVLIQEGLVPVKS